MRHLLGEMVDRVDLYFDRVQRGKRVECPTSKGVATLRHIPGMLGCDNRGNKTPLELFLAGVRGWEAEFRRSIGDHKSSHSKKL